MNRTRWTALSCSVLLTATACRASPDEKTDERTTAGNPKAQAAAPAPTVVGSPPPVPAGPTPPPPNPPVLATYEAPGPIADKVAGVLRLLVAEGENPLGRVASLPGGRIVVVAPASIQDGVRNFLETVRNGPVPPPPAAVRLRYWLVLGRPAAQPAGLERLGEAAPAMEAVMGATGPLDVRLLDRVELISLENKHGMAQGRRSEITQRVARTENGFFADLRIGTRARLDTRVLLEPGKLVVLGQVGYDEREAAEIFGEAPDAATAAQGATLFHVVQAEPVSPPGG